MLTTQGWNATASKQLLLDVYHEFGSTVTSLLNLVDEKDLKIWELLDMSQLSTWTNGRTALIGDAAHPFLPRETAFPLGISHTLVINNYTRSRARRGYCHGRCSVFERAFTSWYSERRYSRDFETL
jgi:hypothetical protein